MYKLVRHSLNLKNLTLGFALITDKKVKFGDRKIEVLQLISNLYFHITSYFKPMDAVHTFCQQKNPFYATL